jgi:peptidase E
VGAGRIVAIGGAGFAGQSEPILRLLLELTGAERPRVAFLPTASGDSREYIVRFYESFTRLESAPSHVELHGAPERARVRAQLLAQDAIYVGGGNTANMLAVWRLHGVDEMLREAWERGIVLGGTSAGANCWFEACTTDSFGPIAPLRDGLGFLPGSFSPHYDAEPERRPTYLRLVGQGFPAGYAADDGAALRFAGTELAEVVTTGEGRAYRVERGADGRATEIPLDPRRLG